MIALEIDNYFKFDTQPDTILHSFCIISHMLLYNFTHDTYHYYLQYNLTHEQVSWYLQYNLRHAQTDCSGNKI